MNKTVLLFLIIFFLFPQTSFGQIDPFYQTCEPVLCGNISITYPFLIESIQPPYCGYTGFEIACTKNRPVLNLSGNPYIITNINYQFQLLTVTNSAFLSVSTLSCSAFHNGSNLIPDFTKFNYFYSPELIFLFQGCKASILRNASSHNKIKCSDGNSQSRSVLAIYPGMDSASFKEATTACRNVTTVPYEKEFGVGVTGVEEMLKKGLLLKWFANNCTRCADSGGRCGYNQNTTELQCFCRDRPHHSECHPDMGFIKHSSKTNKLSIILGSALAISGVIILVGIIILLWSRRKMKQRSLRDKERTLDSAKSDVETGSKLYGLPLFSYNDLKDATNNFDVNKELGEGGFGTVYHGKLKDGREVAVKRLYEKSGKIIEQFMNEVHILTGLRHKNLVSLYGCTSHHSRELLLVYEYLPNGTVADHLQGDKADSNLLTWSIRMKIAIETASALSYLHASDIIHRDVKTSNILLDNDFSVKVADFGLSRLFPSFVTHVSTVPQGTPGYVAPEYYQCYQLTAKSDVYSFGVVLIELLSSLPAVDIERHSHEINLSNYAMNKIQCNAFSELIDPKLGFDSDFKIKRMTILVAELAFQCLQQERELRPSIVEVLEELRRIESADYNVIETEETRRKDILGKAPLRSTKLSPSPTENDAAGLLRNVQPPPPSPDSVMDKWMSKSTTPNASI